MLSELDKALLEKLEEDKKAVVLKMEEIKQSKHICFLTYHKLKKEKRKINSDIKKMKNKSIPDIIA